MEQGEDLSRLVDESERIGVIGSPSSTSQLTLDILGTAATKKLVGELSLFNFHQDARAHYALGQITEIELRNIWMQDPTMRSLVRQRGRVDPVSEKQDTHLGRMTVSAVFSDEGEKFEASILGTVPATGTLVHLVTDEILQTLLGRYQDEIFYLGNVYGSAPKLPLWFKHFGIGHHGAGEAYHIGIFGRTGSGKSVLAKMVLLAYARYPEMAIFVIDPQGEFAKDMRGELSLEGFRLELDKILPTMGKGVIVKSVRELVLDRWDLFAHILAESPFFERLGIHTSDKRDLASQVLRENLERNNRLDSLFQRDTFNSAWEILQNERVLTQIYSGREYRERLLEMVSSSNANDFYNDYWLPVTNLFNPNRIGATKIDSLIYQALDTEKEYRPVVVVDLSREAVSGLFWNDTIQALVIKRLFDGLNYLAESAYKENRFLNTLVILDEAHRLAPREKPENEAQERVRNALFDAVKTTRKYGLGWMFISQTLSSLHREIVNQLRIFFFGFGLALGTEFHALGEIIGGDPNSLKLYQTFRDPHSAFDIASRQYSFMTVGPVSPLSFAGTPLFLTAFNTPDEFLRANRLLAGSD